MRAGIVSNAYLPALKHAVFQRFPGVFLGFNQLVADNLIYQICLTHTLFIQLIFFRYARC